MNIHAVSELNIDWWECGGCWDIVEGWCLSPCLSCVVADRRQLWGCRGRTIMMMMMDRSTSPWFKICPHKNRVRLITVLEIHIWDFWEFCKQPESWLGGRTMCVCKRGVYLPKMCSVGGIVTGPPRWWQGHRRHGFQHHIVHYYLMHLGILH